MFASLLVAGLLAAQRQGQTPAPPAAEPSACSQALAGGTSAAVSELCLAEEQVRQASAAKEDAERLRRLNDAAGHYRRASNLATESQHRLAAFEALAVLYAPDRLNEYDQLEAALRELIDLRPGDLDPVFRLAKAQEDRKLIEAAEDTLLTARRQHPDDVEPFRRLAQFYARRATAMSGVEESQQPQSPQAAGQPDDHGVYRVGGGISPPTRLDRAVYPPEAQAAGIEGAVVAEVVIDPSGDVVDARVVRSIPLLDEAALAAVRNWHFAPTLVNGQAVPVRMTVTVNFSTK